MKSVKKLNERYRKTLSGTASPKEQELMARWLNRLEIGEAVNKQALAEWQKRAMAELQERIEPPVPIQSRSRERRFAWTVSAAAVLLFTMGALLIRSYNSQPVEEEQQAAVYAEHSTAAGQRKLLTLADGSRVWLGNASKIRYPENFQLHERKVFLEGQAFFEVKPDSTKPFFVHTGDLDVRVLGTSFDVKHYSTDAERTVTVASGKVSVKPAHDGQEWMLEKGERVSYRPAEKTATVEAADLPVALGWKDGELVFREIPLEAIAIQLERWYGVEIHIIPNSLQIKKMSLSVKNEPLQTVLKMLSVAGNFDFEIQERHVKIWK